MTSEATATRSTTTRSRANGSDHGGNVEAVQAAAREVRSSLA